MGAAEFGAIAWMDPPPEELVQANDLKERTDACELYAEYIRIRHAKTCRNQWSDCVSIASMRTVEPELFAATALTLYRYYIRLTTNEGAIGPNVFWNAVIANPQGVMDDARNWQQIQAQVIARYTMEKGLPPGAMRSGQPGYIV